MKSDVCACPSESASPATASVSIPTWASWSGSSTNAKDCQERMVVPLEFDNEEDYRAFRDEMLADGDGSEE